VIFTQYHFFVKQEKGLGQMMGKVFFLRNPAVVIDLKTAVPLKILKIVMKI